MTAAEFFIAHGWQLLALAVLLAGSAFFSGSETALFSLSGRQLRLMADAGRAGRIAASLMRRPGRVLNTLLLGNMLVNVAYAGIAAAGVLQLRSAGAAGWAVAVASLAPLVALILVGEVAPKMLALSVCRGWATMAAGPLALIARALSPLLRVADAVTVWPLARLLAPRHEGRRDITADELAALLDLSAKRGIIGPDTNALLQEIVELTDIRVAEVMVPRVDVIAYDADSSPEGLGELFRSTRLRKIPVYERDIDHTLGVVHAKRLLLQPAGPLRELVVKVPFVPETANIERVLLQLRLKRSQMAVVVDEYGGTAGLVTLEDILEEIVGDIPDPHGADRGPAVRRQGEREYLIDGDLAIHEWADAFKMDLGGRRISTIGGFVTAELGRIGRAGEQVTYRNLRFTVESMRGRRIETLRLELMEAAP